MPKRRERQYELRVWLRDGEAFTVTSDPGLTPKRFALGLAELVDRLEACLARADQFADGVTIDHHLNPDPIHTWFELTYAQYLTIPRSVLQSMPEAWQRRFKRSLDDLDEAIDWRPEKGCYRVELRQVVEKREDGDWVSGWGRLIRDPLRDYARGRRRVPTRADATAEAPKP